MQLIADGRDKNGKGVVQKQADKELEAENRGGVGRRDTREEKE